MSRGFTEGFTTPARMTMSLFPGRRAAPPAEYDSTALVLATRLTVGAEGAEDFTLFGGVTMGIHLHKMRLVVPVLIACAVFFPSCQDGSSGAVEPSFAKGGNPGPDQPRYTLTFHFLDQESDSVVGDGRVTDSTGAFTAYTNGECGVAAVFFGANPILSAQSDPIKPSQTSDCGGDREGRVFEVHFAQSYDGNGDPVELAWDGQPADAKWFELRNRTWTPVAVRNLPKGDTVVKALWITFTDQGNHPGGNGWGQACPGLLRFDEDWGDVTGVHATGVQVTRLQQQSANDPYDEWEIKAAPDGYTDANGHVAGDVAACLGGTSEFYLLGYYHVPFQVNVVCRTDDGEDC